MELLRVRIEAPTLPILITILFSDDSNSHSPFYYGGNKILRFKSTVNITVENRLISIMV